MEAIARIAKDFAPEMTPTGLADALGALGMSPPAQRLGFVLELLHLNKLAKVVEAWLTPRRLTPQLLEPEGLPSGTPTLTNGRWAIEFTLRHQEQIEELK